LRSTSGTVTAGRPGKLTNNENEEILKKFILVIVVSPGQSFRK
jgi:hypothetical protein